MHRRRFIAACVASPFGAAVAHAASGDLAAQFNALAGQVAKLGLGKGSESNVERYVTGKALDGLYLVIGDEEKKIRRDPVGSGSALLAKVFGR